MKKSIYDRLEKPRLKDKPAVDCKFILRGERCPFGSRCKFNHPPRSFHLDYDDMGGHVKILNTLDSTPREKYYSSKFSRSSDRYKPHESDSEEKEVSVELDGPGSKLGSDSHNIPRLIKLKNDDDPPPSVVLDDESKSRASSTKSGKKFLRDGTSSESVTPQPSPRLTKLTKPRAPQDVSVEDLDLPTQDIELLATTPTAKLPKKKKIKGSRLPGDWQVVVSKSGGTYYYNSSTGQSVWDIPPELQEEEYEPGELVETPEVPKEILNMDSPPPSRKRERKAEPEITFDKRARESPHEAPQERDLPVSQRIVRFPSYNSELEEFVMPTYSTRVQGHHPGQLTAEEASDRHYFSKLRAREAEILETHFLNDLARRPEYSRVDLLEGHYLSPSRLRVEDPTMRDWPRGSAGRRGFPSRIEELDFDLRDRERLGGGIDRFERADRLGRLEQGDRGGLDRYERLDRLVDRDRFDRVDRERERERIERFRDPQERERPRSRERFGRDRDRDPWDRDHDRDRDRNRVHDRDRAHRDHDRDRDRDRDRERERDRDRDWWDRDRDRVERSRDRERDRPDMPRDNRLQDRPRERERDRGEDRPQPARSLETGDLRVEKGTERREGGDGGERDQNGQKKPKEGEDQEEKRVAAADQVEAMGVDADASRDEAKKKRAERLGEEAKGELEAQGSPRTDVGRGHEDEDEDGNDDNLLRGRDTFELLRLHPEKRREQALREVVPHVSEGLLGRELSSAILKLLPATKLMNPIPFGVEQELEKVFVDELVARFPSHSRKRGVSPPRSITADSDWQQRTLLALRGPDELEAQCYGLPDPNSRTDQPLPPPVSQELMHSCLRLLDASQRDGSKGAFGFRVVPSKLGFLKIRQTKGMN